MNRIEKLTPEQLALLPKQRDKWIKAGLSTEPANRARAEEGVRKAYRAAGLEPPRVIIWLDSPLAGAYGQALTGMLLSELAKRPRAQVGVQVGAQVGAQVWDQVWAQVRAQVGDQVKNWTSGLVYDYYAVIYSAWFQAMHELGVEGMAMWDGHAAIGRNAYWWWAYRDHAILTERPTELHRDPLGRLHCETGPAMSWPDGWGFHAWHGTRVPASLIEQGWTTKEIFAEPNAEIRRCAIERMGWDEFVTAAGLTQVGDAAADPGNPGHTLTLHDVPSAIYGEPVRVLLCVNGTVERDGTRRRFGLTVPATCRTPIEAAAWTYDLTPQQYATAQRRA